jgi:hypothetical protein
LLILVVGGLWLLPTGGATAEPAYNISVVGSYDTPTDTVTVEGEQFTVSGVGTAAQGEELTVSVDAPADAEYQINLYTLDQQVQDFRAATGSETVTFDTSLVDPGSYVVAAVDNQEFFAVHPVVVTDYSITTAFPDQVPTDTAVSGSVTIEPTPGENPVGAVEVVLWNSTWRDRIPLTTTESGRYTGTVPGLANGTYRVSTVVIAAERIDGEENVLAVSEPATLVADPTLTTPINDTDNVSDPGEGPGSNTDGQSEPAEDDNGGVISPNNGSTTADASGEGFGLLTALFAGVLVFGAGRLVSAAG